MKNRFLFIALALLTLPALVQAQFKFITNNGAITINGYTGAGGIVTIPSAINGWPVTAIGFSAFFDNANLTGVLIPDNVTSIGQYAFSRCSGLRSVTIPNSVTSIGGWAFAVCSGLTSVTIPNSVTSIGERAFLLCSGLTNIDVAAANPNYVSAGGVLFNKSMTLLIQYPAGLTGSYAIPKTVTRIGYSAFGGPGLTNVTIPDSVTRIDDDAFGVCSGLTSVTIPNSVTSIGGDAFEKCSGLTNVTIPNSVTSIGNWAFEGCSNLTSVTIPNSVTDIGFGAFGSCSGLTNVTIGKGVTSIGKGAFLGCVALHQAYFQGNAPTLNTKLGSGDNSIFEGKTGTVYYVPSTTGWSNTFGGWPTAQK